MPVVRNSRQDWVASPLKAKKGTPQPHDERAGDVDQRRRIGKSISQQTADAEIDAVADGGPQPAADKYNEKTHDLSFMLTGRQSRPGAERCPTAARASAPAKRPGLPGCLAELLRNQTR